MNWTSDVNSEHVRYVGRLLRTKIYRLESSLEYYFSPTLLDPNCGRMMELTRFPTSKQLLSHLQGSVGYFSALQQIVMGVADSLAEIAGQECMQCR